MLTWKSWKVNLRIEKRWHKKRWQTSKQPRKPIQMPSISNTTHRLHPWAHAAPDNAQLGDAQFKHRSFVVSIFLVFNVFNWSYEELKFRTPALENSVMQSFRMCIVWKCTFCWFMWVTSTHIGYGKPDEEWQLPVQWSSIYPIQKKSGECSFRTHDWN